MAFVAGGSLFARLNASLLPALAVMGVCLTVILAFFLARRLGLNPYVFVPACIVAFALGMPRPFAPADPVYARELGSSALFLALVVDLVAAGIVVLAERFVPKAFATLAGAAVVVAISVGLYGAGISLGAELLGAIRPLGTLGDTYLALVTITFIEAALWMLGIHGPALLAAVVTPVYLTLQFANTDAFAHHRPLPHIVTVSTFLFVFPGGAGATLPLVLHLLRSRVSRIRKVALAALVPGIFNTNEPLMFGLPVVLEPILAIPYIGVPCVLATTTYFAMAYGWVGRPVLYIPSTVPTLVSVVSRYLRLAGDRAGGAQHRDRLPAVLAVRARLRTARAIGGGRARGPRLVILDALLARFPVHARIAAAARRGVWSVARSQRRARARQRKGAARVRRRGRQRRRPRGHDRLRLRRPGPRALRVVVGAGPGRGARAGPALDRQRHACDRGGAGGMHRRRQHDPRRRRPPLRHAAPRAGHRAPRAVRARPALRGKFHRAGMDVDLAALREACRAQRPAVVFVQRSRGYASRRSLSVDDCARIVAAVRESAPDAIILVTRSLLRRTRRKHEPSAAGADLIAGSLIKNLGGGIAPAGGYVAGRSALIERVAAGLYAPGLGAGLGPSLDYGRLLMQGLFYAPLVVAEALRGLDFAAALFAGLGFAVDPAPGARRSESCRRSAWTRPSG